MKKYIPGALLVTLILVGVGFLATSSPSMLGASTSLLSSSLDRTSLTRTSITNTSSLTSTDSLLTSSEPTQTSAARDGESSLLSPIRILPILAPVRVPTVCNPDRPITVTVDPSSPAGGQYTAGTSGNDFGHFRITANCDVVVGGLSLSSNFNPWPNHPGGTYYWYDGANLLGSSSNPLIPAISNPNGYFRLTAGQSKIITVKIDLNPQVMAGALRNALDVQVLPMSAGVVARSEYTPWFKISALPCILNWPTLIQNASTPADHVAVGTTTGVTDATTATYNFTTTGCDAIITELGFSSNHTETTPITSLLGTIKSIRMGTTTMQMVVGASEDTARFTGLNMIVPNSVPGTNVSINVSYPPIGLNGIGYWSSARLSAVYAKYTINGTPYKSTFSVTAPTMNLTASRPEIQIRQPAGSLSLGNVEIIDVLIDANPKGDILLESIPLSITVNGATVSTAANSIIVKDGSNNTLATTSTPLGANGGNTVIGFGTGWGSLRIPANSGYFLKIYIPVTSITGGSPSAKIISKLNGVDDFVWIDGNSIGGNLWNAHYLYNYPANNISEIHN